MNNAIINNINPLYNELKNDFKDAKSIKILVSFLRESGAKLIVPLFKAVPDGCKITIVTGRYLNITEPSALYYIKKELSNNVELKFYNKNVISFHPKVYIIEKENEEVIYIGSSNISKAALLNGIEWNYRLKRETDKLSYDKFNSEFININDNLSIIATDEIIKEYKKIWQRGQVAKELDIYEKSFEDPEMLKIIEPRGAQIEALYELSNARAEGLKRGLVAAATGVGKTYLAAFDSTDFKKVLFVAHREEILTQAYGSFKNVFKNKKTYGYFKGTQKNTDSDIIFASNQTLGKEEYLNEKFFKKNEFDYIVIDEFHHAAANTYRKIIEYFKPKFLLGLTATPYRMDNQDIFSLCNNNLIYDITIKEAINRDLLVPFDYHAIYDSTDYNNIKHSNGKYDKKDLEKKLSTNKRADIIIDHYKNLGGTKTIAFCAGISHAEYMAKEFNDKGIKARTVHSKQINSEFKVERDKAIKMLSSGEVEVLFTVDMFNEGVDIPTVDTVLFLRPTESYVIFLQQLGRGLRLAEGKDKLTVLDFIGNYKRAHFIPKILSGENPFDSSKKSSEIKTFDYPKDCNVQFDFRLINLFKTLENTDPIRVQMKEEYFRLKNTLGYRPLRVDIYNGVDIDFNEFRLKSKRGYNGYLKFLEDIKELTDIEKSWMNGYIEGFLLEIERTSMAKSYKIPLLKAFIDENKLKMKVSLNEIGIEFKNYYSDSKLHQKDLNNKRHFKWENWDLNNWENEARMNPIKYLNKTEYFYYDEINKEFKFADALEKFNGIELRNHFKDIIEYKNINYFARRY